MRLEISPNQLIRRNTYINHNLVLFETKTNISNKLPMALSRVFTFVLIGRQNTLSNCPLTAIFVSF